MKRILLSIVTVLTVVTSIYSQVPTTEKNALIDFYNATNGSNWTNNTNWNTANPVSTWHGITVEEINTIDHVTGISFNDNNTAPNIPASIQNLTQLKEFFIVNSFNAFSPTGTIPSEIGSLSNLTTLWLENWNLQGSLPTEIGNLSALETLVIRGTSCSGNLPASFVSLNSIGAISLNNNNFFGALPDLTPISNQLTFFRIQDNFFEFGDFETEFSNYQVNIPAFTYAPQTGVFDGTTEITLNVGDSYQMFAVDVSGANNLYQWYFNDQVIIGETNTDLQLTNFQAIQSGTYHCEVTSSVVTGLSITAGTFIVGQNPTSHPDYNALVALYNATDGANWTNNTNWLDLNQPILNWYGITEENGRVTAIVHNSNNLSGNIPVEITAMTELKNLSLQNNNLSGEIPSNIGDLANLEFFMVWNNNPSAQYSKLSGTVPASFANCTNLSFLAVGGHNLEGPIPDLTGLNNLVVFFIENNKFAFGDFENEFSTYSANIGTNFVYAPQISPALGLNTRTLDIGASTTLNSEPISGVNNIYQWYLNGQAISGANTIDLTLSNFQANEAGTYECLVSNTIVTGLTISAGVFEVNLNPASHPDYPALVAIYNATQGTSWINNTNWLDPTKPLSTWYGITETNGRVTNLSLNSNQLIGTIPPEIGDLVFLDLLDISANFLSGTLPTELGNLQNATWLDLRNNYFDGNIPISITSIPNLYVFLVSNNNLSGAVPDFSTQTTNLLDFLYIDNNQFVFADFEAEFPVYNANMATGFVYAPQKNVDTNRGVAANIGDTVTLSALPNLGTQLTIDWYNIDINGNYTYINTGNTVDVTITSTADYGNYIYYITSAIAPSLGLESNFITIGPDPATHPDYDALLAIYNALDGPNWANSWDITAPIETWDPSIVFDNVTNRVTSLYMHDQNLTGQLPAEIGDLSELTYLDISSQGITGNIPPEISNLTNLTDLWLIDCDLSGEVPSSIWTMTSLKNLLIGIQNSRQLTLNNGVPAAISNLQNLEWLNLTRIPIGQPLPDELFALPNLIRLRAAECGLSGAIPAGIANIDNVILDGNDYDGAIPTEIINSTGNSSLTLSNNYYDFTDLEPLVMANNYTTLSYSPQRTRDVAQSIETLPGNDIVLDVDDSGIGRTDTSTARANIYQWYKDDTVIIGANGSTYTITNAQESDSGIYYCEISNSLLPDLVIQRAEINILVSFNIPAKITSSVFLQGPYDSGSLSDDLRAAMLIPTTSPYVDALTCNPSVFNITGSDAIVDWVWMEVRDVDGTTVTFSTSALIQSDGDVVGMDGISPLVVDIPDGNYFVMLSHRNHLGVLTASTVGLSKGITTNVDLTSDSALVNGGLNGIADLGDGKYGLYSGDYNGDGQIQNSDKSSIQGFIGISGTSDADLDMNGQVQNTDVQIKLNPNVGKGEQFGSRINLSLYAKRRIN